MKEKFSEKYLTDPILEKVCAHIHKIDETIKEKCVPIKSRNVKLLPKKMTNKIKSQRINWGKLHQDTKRSVPFGLSSTH